MKKVLFPSLVFLCFLIGMAGLYYSTRTKPYVKFEPTFQYRGQSGEKLKVDIDTLQLFNLADSLYAWQVEMLQRTEEQKFNIKEQKPDFMALLGSIALLIGAIVGMAKLITDTGTQRLALSLDEFKQDQKQEHAKIVEILEVVKDNTVRKSVIDSIRKVGQEHIHFKKGMIPDNFQTLIEGQTERLVELSEQIMTQEFSTESLEIATIKLNEQCRIAWRQVTDLFGSDFLPYYKEGQKAATDRFIDKLQAIVSDAIYNAKYSRYKLAAKVFLNELIEETTKQYKRYEKDTM